MTDRDIPPYAVLQKSTLGVLLVRALEDRRVALERVAELEAAGLDEERLARALLRAMPGFQRWMAYGSGTESAHEWEARADAMLTEARNHAFAIAKAYREDTDA